MATPNNKNTSEPSDEKNDLDTTEENTDIETEPDVVIIEKKELEDLRSTAEEYENKYWRTLADLENTRKRLQREKQEHTKFAIKDVLLEFLPPLDHFEKALQCTGQASDEINNWALGFKMILDQFKEVLGTHNITIFHSHGSSFDPHIHEAVETVETEEHPDGFILDEFAPGYKMGDQIIRAACVKVAKTPAKPCPATEDDEKELKETIPNEGE